MRLTKYSSSRAIDTSQPLKIDIGGWTPVHGATYAITIGATQVGKVIASSSETDATLAEKLRLAIDDTSTYAATLSGTTISVTLQAGGRVTDSTTASQSPPRTLNLSTMTVVSGGRYTVNVGAVAVNVVATNNSLSTFVTDLTSALHSASGLDAQSSGNIITLIDENASSGVDRSARPWWCPCAWPYPVCGAWAAGPRAALQNDRSAMACSPSTRGRTKSAGL